MIFTRSLLYPYMLFDSGLNSLEDTQEKISRPFFQSNCKPTSCLCHLVSAPRDTSTISWLQNNDQLTLLN